MASCYHCGRSGASYRRTVTTGYSTGSWTSKRSYGSSSRTYQGLRSLCEDCAAQVDKKNAISVVLLLGLVAVGLVYYIAVR
jgi:hypothetical protein